MLTDAKCRNAKPAERPYKLTDAKGLYLEVRPSGAKLWRYRYRIAGKENLYALGEYPTTGLERARAERVAARELVKQGIHPAHNRKAQKARQLASNENTFQTVATRWVDLRATKAKWSPYYRKQVAGILEADAYPFIGSLPIRSVTSAHLLEIIRRVEERGAETIAILLRQTCSAIFRHAVSNLLADADPAAALRGAIERPKVQHSKPLAPAAMPKFHEALTKFGGYRPTIIALRLLMLTFVRTIELRAAEWKEFDLDGAQWRIPASRMKMREAHIVPLSTQAVLLLRELQTLTGGQRYLFPNNRAPKKPMAATTLNRALERMGYGGRLSAHGFRATASTVLNECGYKADVIERQLAHKERSKTRGSYNQAQYLAERQEMMQQWADMLDEFAKVDKKVIAGQFGKAA